MMVSRYVRVLIILAVLLLLLLGGAVVYLGHVQPPNVTMIHHTVMLPEASSPAAGVTLPDMPGPGTR